MAESPLESTMFSLNILEKETWEGHSTAHRQHPSTGYWFMKVQVTHAMTFSAAIKKKVSVGSRHILSYIGERKIFLSMISNLELRN